MCRASGDHSGELLPHGLHDGYVLFPRAYGGCDGNGRPEVRAVVVRATEGMEAVGRSAAPRTHVVRRGTSGKEPEDAKDDTHRDGRGLGLAGVG